MRLRPKKTEMIEKLSVSNFKSLDQLELAPGKFTCLIGMNGAGKTTVLQAIDFISQLMWGHVDEWLEMREWTAGELASKFSPNATLGITIDYRTSDGTRVVWTAGFKPRTLLCTAELISIGNKPALIVRDQQLTDLSSVNITSPIAFTYQGSVLSQLRDDALPKPVLEMRDALRRIRSLELLAPNLMRRRSRLNDNDIGAGGEKLSAFLHAIKGDQRDELLAVLKQFYPQLVDFKVTSQRAGWKKLSVFEQFGEHRIETEARHLNDGLLRVLAILAQARSNRSLTLLDEIENGINPEIVEKLVDVLVNAPQQVLVTTHSPMILNYLDDDVARKSVQFVYKNPEGQTRVRPFFGIERIGKKLEVMGPGEAFVDTDLEALTAECVEFDRREAKEKKPLQLAGRVLRRRPSHSVSLDRDATK